MLPRVLTNYLDVNLRENLVSRVRAHLPERQLGMMMVMTVDFKKTHTGLTHFVMM